MLADMSIKEFLDSTASDKPTPGGGSIAALCGAVACALSSMVAALTVNNDKYSDVKDEMERIIYSAKECKDFFIGQIDADANAFESVMEAYRMPKGSDKEKESRSDAIQKGLKKAAEEPLIVAQKAFKIMDMIEDVVKMGNVQALTDGAIAALMARTAVMGALYNVEINLASVKDDAYRHKMHVNIRKLREDAYIKEKDILDRVKI